MKLSTRWCSSLVKVFPDREPQAEVYESAMVLRGEIFSLQFVYRAEDFHAAQININIDSPLKEYIDLRKVELVPVEFTGNVYDDDYADNRPGLYPDRLSEIKGDCAVAAIYGQWRSLWLKVSVPEDLAPGTYPITVSMHADPRIPADGEAVTVSNTFTLEVLPGVLPEQRLINTHWFYADCLATYYNVPVFSEEHWRIIGNFMKSAVDHGINMILTPIFTPPLDTKVGGERPTVQLVDVKYVDGKYSFGFDRFDRWVALAESFGVKYFEISHLFSQWGAGFAPKIVADTGNGVKRIFGWDVASDSPEYVGFLDAFLPEFAGYLKKKGLQDRVYFHCSDEPKEVHLEVYSRAAAIMRKHLEGFKIMDALSDVDFYKKGVISIPVPVENHLEEFLAAGMKERWTYYCCLPMVDYPNRFIHLTSSRNRVMGAMFYYFGVQGFLHWGFNFYYSRFSIYPIDPYRSTDSGGGFPAGDGFLLYPGADGIPEDSIRYEVFREALQDQRAMELLETLVPADSIRAMLDTFASDGSGKLTMKAYPRGEAAVLEIRNRVNQLLRENLQK